jgi:hypothetical protein
MTTTTQFDSSNRNISVESIFREKSFKTCNSHGIDTETRVESVADVLLRLSRRRRKSQRDLLRQVDSEQNSIIIGNSCDTIDNDMIPECVMTDDVDHQTLAVANRRPHHRRRVVSISSSSGSGSDFFTAGRANDFLFSDSCNTASSNKINE